MNTNEAEAGRESNARLAWIFFHGRKTLLLDHILSKGEKEKKKTKKTKTSGPEALQQLCFLVVRTSTGRRQA